MSPTHPSDLSKAVLSKHRQGPPINPHFFSVRSQLSPKRRNSHLSGSDGLADTLATLPRVQPRDLTVSDVGTLLDDLLALGEDELDVAGVGHVRVDLLSLLADTLLGRPLGNIRDRAHGRCVSAAWEPG